MSNIMQSTSCTDWQRMPLREVAEIVMGQSPAGHTYNTEGRGKPLINGPVEFGPRFPTKIQWTTAPTKMCLRGDVLFCVRGSTTGRLNISNDEYCIGRGVAAVRGIPGASITTFLEYWLRVLAVGILEEAKGSGSTFPNISSTRLGAIEIPIPTLPEQRQIAAVLDTVDEAIRNTEQIIVKLGHVKQGLLHDLLTRGIDDNGELRDPNRNPDQFKMRGSWRIPVGWDVESVQNLLAPVTPAMRSGPFGSALLKHELVAKGVPLLGIDNVHVERFVREFVRFVTPAKAAELSRYLVRPQDVMITIMGTVGRSCLVPEDIGGALSSKHVWTLTFDQERYSPLLACLQFNHAPWVLRHFAKDEQGGIMSAIRSDTLRTVLLPVPPRAEAARIEQILVAHSARLASEMEELAKLRLLKQGLMEDLLTGRVRVTPLLGATPAHPAGWVEATAGSIDDPTFVRPPQGVPEKRDELEDLPPRRQARGRSAR